MDQLPTEGRNFFIRIISALVLAPPVLAAIYFGDIAFAVLVTVGFIILAWEWIGLCGVRIMSWIGGLFVSSGLISLYIFFVGHLKEGLIILCAGAGIFACSALVSVLQSRSSQSQESATRKPIYVWLSGGLLYIGLALLCLLWLRNNHSFGRDLIFWLFLVTWMSDTGAFAFGRLIGGPKLAPVLSPNKTWAGLVGAIICAGGLGGLLAVLSGRPAVLSIVFASAVLGIISQTGDLLESSVKRHFKVKDVSKLIPGHGGLLDRTDSLLAMSLSVGFILFVARDEVMRWM